MKLIEKVEIHRFRSISDINIKTEEVTIFSGINNSGKSNVLRALNLFFNGRSNFDQEYNFSKDYNLAYTGQARGQRIIKIVLHFGPQGDVALKYPFSISRTFGINAIGGYEYQSVNQEIQSKLEKNDGNIKRQFTTFLNKIEYFYIPAVRDRKFVQTLFLHFEKLIEFDSGEEFEEKVGTLSEILSKKSEDISKDFEVFIGLPTQAKLSSKITDILGTVEINVKSGIQVVRRIKGVSSPTDVHVNLFSSGDGILMSYLAYFLAHICKKISNRKFIWGFEEPENSLEYSKVQKIANDFFTNFKNNAQIFITTHSPAFINLKGKKGVNFYRVFIKPGDTKQISEIKTLNEIEKKQQSLFKAGELETHEYKKLKEELNFIEFAKEIEIAVNKVMGEEKILIQLKKKFDNKYQKLLALQPSKIFICEDSTKESINLWKRLLGMVGVRDVKIMSSEGSIKNFVELGVRHQQKLDIKYQPKIFRQIDRDGLTDNQIKLIKEKVFRQEKGLIYKLEYLPVNELENFAVLADSKSFNSKFWRKNKTSVINSFELTATDKCKYFDKIFDYHQSEFRPSSGNYTIIMQEMRASALTDWKKFFPGKEMCKCKINFNPLKFIKSLKKKDLPQELVDYLNVVANFYK